MKANLRPFSTKMFKLPRRFLVAFVALFIFIAYVFFFPSISYDYGAVTPIECTNAKTCKVFESKFVKISFLEWLKLQLTSKHTQQNTSKSKKILQDKNLYDYSKLSPRFTRVPGWPEEFPENLAEYRSKVIATTYPTKQQQWKEEIAPWVVHHRGPAEDKYVGKLDPREKAAIVVLVRNSELEDLRHSMRMMEDRFNHKFNYPYVFLNDKPFSNQFIQIISKATKSNTTFALIPHDHWSVPDDIDMKKAKIEHAKLVEQDVVYGGSMSYRHMCRFNSGFFYKHPLLQELKFYWRLEPDIDFFCDLEYDPFKFMRENKKVYSFVITLPELEKTIPTLWENTLSYAYDHNLTSPSLKMFANDRHGYNLCHFWSNFEIASLDWFRSKQYDSYFEYLDSTGKFFYERWGDAPVHSLAAGLFLKPQEIHFFNDIGYRHDVFARWPVFPASSNESAKCVIPKDRDRNFDTDGTECMGFYLSYTSKKKPYLWDRDDNENALNSIYMNRLDHIQQHDSYYRWRDSIARN